jgi:N-formylmaleamate deformylase
MDRLDLGDWIDQVPKIECPAVLIYGDNDGGFDGIVTPETALKVETMNGNIRAHHVDHAGHNLRREQFEPFISIVRKFLGS